MFFLHFLGSVQEDDSGQGDEEHDEVQLSDGGVTMAVTSMLVRVALGFYM